MTRIKKAWILAPFMLVACGDAAEDEAQQIDYAAYDDAALQKLFDDREYQQVIEIVRGQGELGIADKQDYLLVARIYTLQLDGIAAEVAAERAIEHGAEAEETALLQARAFLIQGKHHQAEQVLEQTVLLEDEAYEALLLRGDISKATGNNEQSRAFYQAAIQDRPDQAAGYTGLALLELFSGNLEEAARQADTALEKSGPDPIVYYVRGTTARYQQDIPLAKEFLQKAIDLHEGHVMAHLELASIHIDENNIEAAERELDSVYSVNPQHSMAQYYTALILASKGEDEKAEEILLRLGDLTRDYPPASRAYGHIAYRLGKFSTAQPFLERFLKIIPGDRATRLALAESLTRRGHGRRALSYLEPLIGDGATDLEALLQASAAAGLLGEVRVARSYLARAEELAAGRGVDENLVKSLSRRLALARFASGETEAALAKLREMFDKDHEDFVSLTLTSNLQMQSGDLDGAEETAKKLIALSPDNPLGPNLLGAIRHRQRQPEEAIGYFNTALSAHAGYVSALKNRGLSYLVLERFEEAIPDLEAAQEKLPNDLHVKAMLGRAYLAVGRIKEAAVQLHQAAEGLPKSAIIAADYSDLMAAQGYMASAISKAEEAKVLAGNNEGLIAYLDEQIAIWNKVVVEEERMKAEEEAERKKALEEERLKLEAERAAEKALEAKEAAEDAAKKAAEEAAAEEGAAENEDGDEPS